MKSGLLFMAFC